MVRDVAFGQYFPGKSLIHKLDPRAKMVCFIAFIILIFFTFNYASLGIVAAFTAFIIIAGGISFKFYFKSLKMILFVVLITSLLNLFYGSGEPIWQWWIIKLTWAGIHRAAFVTDLSHGADRRDRAFAQAVERDSFSRSRNCDDDVARAAVRPDASGGDR